MAESMKESTLMTKNKVREFSPGLTVEGTMETGRMENNMDMVSTILQRVK